MKERGESLRNKNDPQSISRLLTQIMEVSASNDPQTILGFLLTTTSGRREPKRALKERLLSLVESVVNHRSAMLVAGAFFIVLFVGGVIALHGGLFSPTVLAALAALFFSAIAGLNTVLPKVSKI